MPPQEHPSSDPPSLPPWVSEPIVLTLPPDDAATPDWTLRLPASPALLSFDDHQSHPLQLLVTADARAATRKRLRPAEPTDAAHRLSPHADLRPITARVRAWPIGSRFEGDLLFHHIAATEQPELARAMLDRAATWFIHIDPDEPFPKWRRVSTNELAAAPESPLATQGVLLGPIRDKHTASNAIDDLNDLFDLCREHHLLVLAPNANACAYKELGKCPAPCDGSETMDAYRERLHQAIAFWRNPEAWQRRTDHAMQQAAAALNFEHAAHLKQQSAIAARLTAAPFAHAHHDWKAGWLILTASTTAACVRITLASGNALQPLADLPITTDASDAWRTLQASLAAIPPHPARPASSTAWHRLGVIAQQLYAPASPRRPAASPPPSSSTPSSQAPSSLAPPGSTPSGPPPPGEAPETPSPKWVFAALLPANPSHSVNRFTSPDQTDTVQAPVLGRASDPADLPPAAFPRAWQKARRALAKPSPHRQIAPQDADSQGSP